MKVLLVHGIFDDGRLFLRMSEHLNKYGISTYVPALKPSDARYGIRDLAQKLDGFVKENIGLHEKFSIVGFSMGCLISRYYIQCLGGAAKCTSFHAVSGPHNGSLLAYLFVGQGAKDLRPGSSLINELKETENTLENISLFSYRTPFDQMVIPSKSSHWPLAKNYVTKTLIHRFMICNKLVLNTITNNIVEDPLNK